MRNNMARRLESLEDGALPPDRQPYVWLRHGQTEAAARAEAGLEPDSPCVFFKWRAAQ